MVAIIVAAHGETAPALLKTSGMILGEIEGVTPVTFLPGQGPEDLLEAYAAAVGPEEDVLLLVDLFGGSPYNAGARFVAEREHADVVTGVNLPMVIEVLSRRLTGAGLAEAGHEREDLGTVDRLGERRDDLGTDAELGERLVVTRLEGGAVQRPRAGSSGVVVGVLLGEGHEHLVPEVGPGHRPRCPEHTAGSKGTCHAVDRCR